MAAEFVRETEVQADRLGMTDVQVSVGLGRKARLHAALVLVGLQVFKNDVADEIRRTGLGRIILAGRGLCG